MGIFKLNESEVMALNAESEILNRDVDVAKRRMGAAIQRIVDLNAANLPVGVAVFFDPAQQALVWEEEEAPHDVELLEEAEAM